MTDLNQRLLDVQRIQAPDLWTEILSRDPRPAEEPRRARGWILALVGAAVVLASVLVPLALLGSGRSTGPSSGGEHRIIRIDEPSTSMEPTLHVGDAVEVDEDAYAQTLPSRGDIIVFTQPDFPGIDFIKRVIGLPGETVEERDGVWFVDGRRLEEPWATIPDHGSMPPQTVTSFHLFVLGDNRVNSNDSRFSVGQVPLGRVVGKVVRDDHASGGSASTPPTTSFATP
jgi:signal peptidase I